MDYIKDGKCRSDLSDQKWVYIVNPVAMASIYSSCYYMQLLTLVPSLQRQNFCPPIKSLF